MVVGDLLVIRHTRNIGIAAVCLSVSRLSAQTFNQRDCGVVHIFGEILAVRSRIGGELFFVEGLQIIERLLCRKAENTVALTLQGC